MLEITHPYHPLCGKKYKILKVLKQQAVGDIKDKYENKFKV